MALCPIVQPPPALPEPPRPPSRLPELLAPAGDWDCAKAAVENGADAIYFGLDRFNARMRANNFTEADLPRLLQVLHSRGVKGYVTFNTLVFADELAGAERYLRVLIAAGVDAAIVQDVGICRLIRRLSPDFPIHASTQMTITSAAGVEFARALGCSLVVLARECSIKEIQTIARVSLPLEVFVHGALCVAYSGQCLTSEALGGRSANRGECAQACRLPYELIRDGQTVPLGDRRYLLSPQDLAGLEVLPDLLRAGVASLKIEGRLKSPEYVANITQAYRRALDGAAPKPAADTRYNLEMAFSRGLYTGWFGGTDNQRLVHARFGKKRGVYLGEVRRVAAGSVFLTLQAPLKPGDGIVFDAGDAEAEIRIFGQIHLDRIHPGDKVWKTSDPELDRALRRSFSGNAPRFRRPLDLEVHGHDAAPLTLIGRDELGHVARVQSAMPLTPAQNQPLTTERLRDQLGRLGGTPFVLGRFQNNLEGSVILPMSELNRLRRALVSQIEEQRALPPRRPPLPRPSWPLPARRASSSWPAIWNSSKPPSPSTSPRSIASSRTRRNTAKPSPVFAPPAGARKSSSRPRAFSKRVRNGCSSKSAPARPTASWRATTTISSISPAPGSSGIIPSTWPTGWPPTISKTAPAWSG